MSVVKCLRPRDLLGIENEGPGEKFKDFHSACPRVDQMRVVQQSWRDFESRLLTR